MADLARLVGTTNSTEAINALVANSWSASGEVISSLKTRRMLVSRDRAAAQSNATGTVLPPPFDQTQLALKTLIGEVAEAVQVATSRITANPPDISVIPLITGSNVSATVEKMAGEQERLDAQMFYECGGLDAQWEASWAKSLGGGAFWLTLPRDADFGLPDRMYYDDSDEEMNALRDANKLSPLPDRMPSGQLIYAEHGDVWAARRKAYMQDHAVGAVNGRGLFTLQTYPRDMVMKERDRESKDLKWAAIVEEIPALWCEPGSNFMTSLGRAHGLQADDQGLYGIFVDPKTKRIIGGTPRGVPVGAMPSTYDAYNLIRFFNRKEQVILIAARGSVRNATELWRGDHGCIVQGIPACPVVEDPFYRTDTNVIGKEYSTVLDEVMAYAPLINQLLTILSNVAAFNGIPRFAGKLQAGSQVRGQDGEPDAVHSAPTPGLNPEDFAWWPGDITQILIDAKTLIEVLTLLLERFKEVMPTLGGDASGADAAAWAIQQRIEEAQQPYKKAVDNSCQAVTGVVQRWHGWLRQLDVPVFFFAAPGHRRNRRDVRGLIQFDPKDLTDSIEVTQSLYTSAEATVLLQIGTERLKSRTISLEEFFDKYAREPDARQKVIDMYVQMGVDYMMTGVLPTAEGPIDPNAAPLIKEIADGVRGYIEHWVIMQQANAAIAAAQQIIAAGQAQQTIQGVQAGPMGSVQQESNATTPVGPPSNGGSPIAPSPVQPGQGMATTLNGQAGRPATAPVMAGGQ